jgi:phage tail sheath protein FI
MVMYDSKAPGVYIEEVSGGARPIQAVGTSTAGFVGVARHPEAPTGEAVAVNSWMEFARKFHVDAEGELQAAENALRQAKAAVERATKKKAAADDAHKAAAEKALAAATKAKEAAKAAYTAAQSHLQAVNAAGGPSTHLVQAVYGFFLNGGTRCYVANIGAGQAAAGAGVEPSSEDAGDTPSEDAGETPPEDVEDPAPEDAEDPAPEDAEDPAPEDAEDPAPEDAEDAAPEDASEAGTGSTASQATLQDGLNWLAKRDEVAIVAAPGYTERGDYIAVRDHCEQLGDRVGILDSVETVDDTADLTDATLLRPPSSGHASFYYPWIQVRDPLSDETVAVPPSGHIAGVWARTDAERGVHKAPANTPVRGAVGLLDQVADDEQGFLNQAGVNCIRFFSSDGILVWGARTLSSDPEWRYLNVRRLLNMIEESIEQSTRWIVFEPNDAPLWAAIRRDVSAFLTRIWRTGALRGTTPEQAFFCKCDEETNPPEEIDAGVVTTVIGVAPVKPAEFVVFRIRQYQPGSEVETQGG